MLRKVGQFNDVSPELMPKLPEKGTIVSYRFKELTVDPLTKKLTYQHQVKIPSISNFFDTEKKQWVKVGLVDSVDNNGNPVNVKRVWAFPQQNAGHFNLTIGESTDTDDLFRYLELASFVDNKKEFRDEGEPLLMERVDHEAEAQRRREKRQRKRDAYKKATGLEGADLIQASLVLGFYSEDNKDKEDLLRDPIEEFAEKYPDEFLQRMDDPHAESKAVLRHAILLSLIKEDGNSLRWADTNGEVLSLVQPENAENEFSHYISTAKDGSRILAEIKRQIEKKTTKPKAK